MDQKKWIFKAACTFTTVHNETQLPQSSDLSVTLTMFPRNARRLQELLLCASLLAYSAVLGKIYTLLFTQTVYFRCFER